MNDVSTVTAPTVQLLAWVAERSRSYAETIEAWKTSCPRLSVREDALTDGLVQVDRGRVLLTTAGEQVLAAPS
jgi:predicted transcriptional regulator